LTLVCHLASLAFPATVRIFRHDTYDGARGELWRHRLAVFRRLSHTVVSKVRIPDGGRHQTEMRAFEGRNISFFTTNNTSLLSERGELYIYPETESNVILITQNVMKFGGMLTSSAAIVDDNFSLMG